MSYTIQFEAAKAVLTGSPSNAVIAGSQFVMVPIILAEFGATRVLVHAAEPSATFLPSGEVGQTYAEAAGLLNTSVVTAELSLERVPATSKPKQTLLFMSNT